MSKNTFTKGDEVVCVEAGSHLTKGKTYTVIEEHPRGLDYVKVVNDRGTRGVYRNSRFAPVNEAPKPLAHGDRVHLVTVDAMDLSRGLYVGCTGTIDQVEMDLAPYVRWDATGERWPVDIHQIERLKPTPKTPIKSVKLDAKDVHEVLTAYVKNTLGIDATVTNIVDAFKGAIELTLKAEVSA